MSTTLRFLALMQLMFFVVALVPAADPPKAAPTKEQIAEWIKQLGANDIDKREEASKKLWEAGQPAEAALEEATKSQDREVRRRSKEILEKFKYGIYPDTPKKVADLVNAFHAADEKTRTGIIKERLFAFSSG